MTGSSLDTHPDILLVRKHLVEHLGAPDEVFEISGSPLPDSPIQAMNLAYFAPAGPSAPVVFATCGACFFEMNDGRRVEAIIILRREPEGTAFDAVHRALASFALFSETNNEAIRYGDVVRAKDELSQFCDMDALLFMPPIPFVETFHQTTITKERKVEIVWLLPVYDTEAQYALDHGPQALMMLFAAQGLDLTEPRRDEANTMIEPSDAQEMAQRASEAAGNAEQGPTLTSPVKPKTSRRNMGKGSFDVSESGGAVKITRRRSAPKKTKPAAPAATIEPPPQETPEPIVRRPPRPSRPIAVKAERKQEIRFDLGKSAKPPEPKPAAEPAQRKPAKPVMTPAQKAEEKKKRIEELKAQAKAAARRAAKRASGEEDE